MCHTPSPAQETDSACLQSHSHPPLSSPTGYYGNKNKVFLNSAKRGGREGREEGGERGGRGERREGGREERREGVERKVDKGREKGGSTFVRKKNTK